MEKLFGGKTKLQRFEEKYISEPNTGCFLWLGATSKDGYGNFRYQRQTLLAHRVAWIFHHGPIPTKMQVLHNCDNPYCVNPSHLFLGTHLDNMHDAWKKGRNSIKKGAVPYNKGARQQQCVNGHSQWYVSPITGVRYCIPCKNEARRKRRALVRSKN